MTEDEGEQPVCQTRVSSITRHDYLVPSGATAGELQAAIGKAYSEMPDGLGTDRLFVETRGDAVVLFWTEHTESQSDARGWMHDLGGLYAMVRDAAAQGEDPVQALWMKSEWRPRLRTMLEAARIMFERER